ncbi:MAG: transposase [Nitrososphaerales archaeon]|nr:transposase [Nitrososphaerales archaeon]
MTYQVLCSTCGCTLYSGFSLRNPADVLKPLGFRCKKCGAKLSRDHFKVDVWRSEDVITSAEQPQLLPFAQAPK